MRVRLFVAVSFQMMMNLLVIECEFVCVCVCVCVCVNYQRMFFHRSFSILFPPCSHPSKSNHDHTVHPLGHIPAHGLDLLCCGCVVYLLAAAIYAAFGVEVRLHVFPRPVEAISQGK